MTITPTLYDAYVAPYRSDEFSEFLTRGLTANSKDQYLSWVSEWKCRYNQISKGIRILKNSRKPFIYSYTSGNRDTKRIRTCIGENPMYVGWGLMDCHSEFLSNAATSMITMRVLAKAASWERKLVMDADMAA